MSDLLQSLRTICPDDVMQQIAALPPALALARIQPERISADIVQQRRAQFSRDAKPAFLNWLAENYADQLTAMGITAEGIDVMQHQGKLPFNKPGEQLDCSIDHITSLNFGGTNDFENLTLIPKRYNAMKDRLETLQQGNAAIITIIPTHNTAVPFIDGGFQRAKGSI